MSTARFGNNIPATPTPATPASTDAAKADVKADLAVRKEGENIKRTAALSTPPKTDAKADISAPIAPSKVKGKVDGKEVEYDIQELLAFRQKHDSANKRFEEAAAKERQLEAFYEAAKADPYAFLEKVTGDSADALAEKRLGARLRAQLEEQQLSPAERALREKERMLGSREAELNAREMTRIKAEEEAHRAAAVDQYTKEYVKGLQEGLQANGLPTENPILARRVAMHAQAQLRAGIPIDWAESAKSVKAEISEELKNYYGSFEGEALLEAIGPDMMRKVNKAMVARFKTAKTPAVPTPSEPPIQKTSSQSEPRKPKSMKDFDKAVNERFDSENFTKAVTSWNS